MSNIKKSTRFTILSFAVGIAFSTSALAHHGSVTNPRLYEAENLVELEGVITGVFWRNPHPRFRLAVVDDSGEETTWELELNGSPVGYARAGITADDVAREGNRVRVAGFIAKTDSNAMGVLHMLLPNGKEFVNGRRELRWSNTRMATDAQPIDPAKVAAAREAANGVFRVWGPVSGADVYESSYEDILTERGHELAALYDPIADNEELMCRQGMPDTMFDRGAPMELIDQGERILIHLQEYDIERVIHMGEAKNPSESQMSPLGYSVGHWEGETLVVTTTNINWPYYNESGTPQSKEVSYTEQFKTAEDGNTLNYMISITDPVVLSEPFVIKRTRTWQPGREVETFDCTAQWEDPAV